MTRLGFYHLKGGPNQKLWRVMVPTGLTGSKGVNFKYKKAAEAFYRVCGRELKKSSRWEVLDFLTSGTKLYDAVMALRLSGDKDRGHWTTRLRRGASLLALVEENIAREPGPFVEPSDRVLHLPPDLHRLVVALARKRGENVNDMIVGHLSRLVKKENEASLKLEEPKGRVRLGDLYRFSLPKERRNAA